MDITGKIHDDLKSFSKQPPPRPYKIPRTWVMVIDQHVARLFDKNEGKLEPIGTVLPDQQKNAEITNKSVGRLMSSAGRSIHHKYEPHMNESRQQCLLFSHQIADWLDQAAREDAFDRIIIAAAPKILGELRKVVTRPVQERILDEINKDFTRLDVDALQGELEKNTLF